MSLYQCPACLEVVEDNEPCWCVFAENGFIDHGGQLHTATRIPVDRNVAEMQFLAEEARRQMAYAALLQQNYDGVDEHAYECYPVSR